MDIDAEFRAVVRLVLLHALGCLLLVTLICDRRMEVKNSRSLPKGKAEILFAELNPERDVRATVVASADPQLVPFAPIRARRPESPSPVR